MKTRLNPSKRLLVSCGIGLVLGLGMMSAAALAQTQVYSCPTGFGIGVPPAPPILITSLKTVPNPVFPKDPVTFLPTLRKDLVEYIANSSAAIQLGKALFWDMQAGSDNKTACATCHFHAGADTRDKNQVNPGPNGTVDGFNANATLAPTDFPLMVAHASSDSIVGSQGVRKSTFAGVNIKTGAESTSSVSDSVFNVGGKNVRQVTGKNAPSIINAIFNHRNFFNGRAQPEFNGLNPWGSRDPSDPKVWTVGTKGPVQVAIRIPNASAASQAVGPALNDVEMSAAGRSFLDLGRKMLLLKPLGLQKVDPSDSVLGTVADSTGAGLATSYKALIQTAFQPKWWNTNKNVTINGKSYSMMEANFSLYWGLAIMLYESTLVSDDSPMDQYLAAVGTTRPGPSHPSASLLNDLAKRLEADGYLGGVPGILNGRDQFERPFPPAMILANGQPAPTGRECTACHMGANLTSASMANLVAGGIEIGDVAFRLAGFDLRMERMFMQVPPVPTDLLSIMQSQPPQWGTTSVLFDPIYNAVTVGNVQDLRSPSPGFPAPFPQAPSAIYDAGWYNVGVRPTADDSGLGGQDPFNNYLSWTRLLQTTLPDPSVVKVPGGGLTCLGAGNATFPGEILNPTGFPLLSGPLLKCQPGGPCDSTGVAGTFKTAALRNAELNGPYFHNGGKSTLKQVVDFYDNGGDFANDTLSPLIKFYGFLSQSGMGMTEAQQNDLVAFLTSLTDERVRWERAPFDHPQLLVPNGDSPAGTDSMVEIKAVGASGSTVPVQRFLGANPFQP